MFSPIPKAIIAEFVITGKGQKDTEPGSKGEEDLGCCVNPHLEQNNTMVVKSRSKHAPILVRIHYEEWSPVSREMLLVSI